MIRARTARAVFALLGASAVAAGGCTALLGIDGDFVEGVANDDAGEGGPSKPDAAKADTGAVPDGFAEQPRPRVRRSCELLPATCGLAQNEDCCASLPVAGGTFNRANQSTAPATIGAFELDRLEATVGRFRKFVDAGEGTKAQPPRPGEGAHPRVPTSGWDAAFDADLPADTPALVQALGCAGGTYTPMPGANENKPVGCVSWSLAFAFCIWDGGRLPTEAEWDFASEGGDDQRVYPWSTPPTSSTIDDTYASYQSLTAPNPAGFKSPKGDGKFGHADLAGNVWEWSLDRYVDPFVVPCDDCANLAAAPYRVVRGGGFSSNSGELSTRYRYGASPTAQNPAYGVRCARDPNTP